MASGRRCHLATAGFASWSKMSRVSGGHAASRLARRSVAGQGRCGGWGRRFSFRAWAQEALGQLLVGGALGERGAVEDGTGWGSTHEAFPTVRCGLGRLLDMPQRAMASGMCGMPPMSSKTIGGLHRHPWGAGRRRRLAIVGIRHVLRPKVGKRNMGGHPMINVSVQAVRL